MHRKRHLTILAAVALCAAGSVVAGLAGSMAAVPAPSAAADTTR